MSTDFFEGFLSLDFSCRALTSWMTWEEIDLALKASTWSELKSFCGFLSHYKFALNIVTNMYPFIPHIWSDRKWRRLWPDSVKLDQPWPPLFLILRSESRLEVLWLKLSYRQIPTKASLKYLNSMEVVVLPCCSFSLFRHVTHVMLIFKRLRLYCEMSYSESDSLGSSLLYFGFNIKFSLNNIHRMPD